MEQGRIFCISGDEAARTEEHRKDGLGLADGLV